MPKISLRTAACADKWSEQNANNNPYNKNKLGTCHRIKSPNSTKPLGFWPNTMGKLHLAKHDCSKALPKAKAPTMVKRTSRCNGRLSTKNADETSWKMVCLENHPQYSVLDLSIYLRLKFDEFISALGKWMAWLDRHKHRKSCLLATSKQNTLKITTEKKENKCKERRDAFKQSPENNYRNVPANMITVIPASHLPLPLGSKIRHLTVDLLINLALWVVCNLVNIPSIEDQCAVCIQASIAIDLQVGWGNSYKGLVS